MKKNEKAEAVYKILKKSYPNAHCELDHRNPFELMIATILSAQCTDQRVNSVTPALFKKYPDAKALSKAKNIEVESIIRPTGFFKNKAKSIIGCAQKILSLYQGEIPKSIEELILLPGVGRKTANVVLGNAFNINEGIVVDTHIKRVSFLMGLTKNVDPEKIEQDLIKLFPRDTWTELAHLFIFLGRKKCIARRPQCQSCDLNQLCSHGQKELLKNPNSLDDTK